MKDSQLSDLQTPYQTPQSDLEQLKSKDAEYGEFNLFSLKGRVGRIRYLVYSIGIVLLYLGIFGTIALLTKFFGSNVDMIKIIIGMLAILVVAVGTGMSLNLMVQRLHDFNMSGWFLLLGLVPLINSFFILLLYIIPGTHDSNRFGPPGPPNKPIEITLSIGLLILFLLGIIASVTMSIYQRA